MPGLTRDRVRRALGGSNPGMVRNHGMSIHLKFTATFRSALHLSLLGTGFWLVKLGNRKNVVSVDNEDA